MLFWLASQVLSSVPYSLVFCTLLQTLFCSVIICNSKRYDYTKWVSWETGKERLRELGLLSLEKRRLGRSRQCMMSVYLKRGLTEDGARLFPVVPSTRTRGSGQKLEHRRCPPDHEEALSCSASDGALAQVTLERLWSLPPWRYSEAIWAWSWATCYGCPCLSQGVGPGGLQGSLPTSTILW